MSKSKQATRIKPEDIEAYWALGDDWANALTHGLGLIFSIVGLFFLIQNPLNENNHWKLFAFAIYGLSLIFLYAASTIYHSLGYHNLRNKRLKHFLRLVDHCAIYLLIAGSYTPFTLVSLQGIWGWTLFGIIWSLAIIGIIFKICYIGRFNRLSTIIYLVMGWLAIVAVEPLINSVPTEGLYWVLAGGLFYTAGIVFFVLDHIRFYHTIWHVFVLGGSSCHYLAICLYV